MSIRPVAPVGLGVAPSRVAIGDERRPSQAELEAAKSAEQAARPEADRIELSAVARGLRDEEPKLRLSTPELTKLITPDERQVRAAARQQTRAADEAQTARRVEAQRADDRRRDDRTDAARAAAAPEMTNEPRTAGRTPASTEPGIKPAARPSDTATRS